MKNVFERLEEALSSVERWLPVLMQQPLKPRDLKLAESLDRYVKYCRRDRRKWQSASAAERATAKVNRTWYTLYVEQKWRP